MDGLKEKVKEKYKKDPKSIENICIDARTFRPNFVIDHGYANSEDDY